MEALSLFAVEQRSPAKSRKRNAIWDALEEIFGYQPLTQSEIKLWGKLVWSLTRAGASRESLIFASKEYQKEFAQASLTPTALEKHYSRYAAKVRKEVIVCPDCETGGGFHSAECTRNGASTAVKAPRHVTTEGASLYDPTERSTPIV